MAQNEGLEDGVYQDREKSRRGSRGIPEGFQRIQKDMKGFRAKNMINQYIGI